MERVILGSKSPRRKEIMEYFNLPFEQMSPPFIEEAIPFKGDPFSYVQTLSEGKAQSLQRLYPHAIIVTADTIVYKKGRVYNKPQNLEEAVQFLTELSGQWHSVFTGVTLVKKTVSHYRVEETRVLFNPLTLEHIRSYLSKISWSDKAGGYAIQLGAGLVVNRIEGCYYNVMGLPVNCIRELFFVIGIDLWSYLKPSG